MTSVTIPLRGSGDTASAVAVRAREVARHYGAGETAVHALRGVDLDVAGERLTAVMGPSGSGKSTLMHILAGLDEPSSGEVVVAGIDIGGLDDTALTKWRRDHIGFIFQFFNLLPMLTAAENIVLPLKLAGVEARPGSGSTSWSRRWVSATVSGTARPSSRAVSSSVWPSRARWCRVRV